MYYCAQYTDLYQRFLLALFWMQVVLFFFLLTNKTVHQQWQYNTSSYICWKTYNLKPSSKLSIFSYQLLVALKTRDLNSIKNGISDSSDVVLKDTSFYVESDLPFLAQIFPICTVYIGGLKYMIDSDKAIFYLCWLCHLMRLHH